MLDKLLEEIKDLKKAKELLEAIYIEVGPYKHTHIDNNTWSKVCDYFNFDDGE